MLTPFSKVPPQKTSPDPRLAGDWGVSPKDFVLYAVKYVNPYHGAYLRRGVDAVKVMVILHWIQQLFTHNEFVEKDEVLAALFYKALTQDTTSLNAKNKGNIMAFPIGPGF
jgi:hypothetical protein